MSQVSDVTVDVEFFIATLTQVESRKKKTSDEIDLESSKNWEKWTTEVQDKREHGVESETFEFINVYFVCMKNRKLWKTSIHGKHSQHLISIRGLNSKQ